MTENIEFELEGKKKKVKINKNRLPREEAKIKAREKRIRRAFRVSRMRAFKNFWYWFFGVLSSFGIILGAVFVCIGVVPISTYVGEETVSDYVGPNIYDKSVLGAILGFDDLTLKDFPIVETSLKDLIGDGENTSFLDEYQKVDTPELISDGSRYKYDGDASDYYYATSYDGLTPFSTGSNVIYEKAFDENGYLLDSLSAKYLAGELELFLPPLLEKSFIDGFSSLGKYINLFELTELLKMVLGDEYESGSFIDNVFSDITIGDLTSESENFGDKIMKKATLDSFGVNSFGDLGDQKFFSEFEKVKKIDYPETAINPITEKETITKTGDAFTANPKMFYIELSPATADEDGVYERAFNDDGEFIPYEVAGETTKYLTLNDVETADKLCYANLAKIPLLDTFELLDESLDRASISTLALGDYDSNEKMYNIILSAKGKMPERELGESDDDYKARVKTAAENLTMKDLENLNTNAVKLSVVIEETSENAKLFSVLADATGIDKDSLTVGDLESFNTNDIKLYSVLDDSGNGIKLYDILEQATGDSRESITIADLSEFEIGNVELATVLNADDVKGNKILSALVNLGKDEEGNIVDEELVVKVSNVGTSINSLKLFDIYGESCFVETANGDYYLNESTGVYEKVSSGDGTHEISTTGGIWLLLCYDYAGTGNYSPSKMTMSDMQTDGNSVSSKVLNATIRQLVDAHMIADPKYEDSALYQLTISEIIKNLEPST